MAEHEIIKHTREIVKVVKKPGDIKHKIGDTLLEIAIIVFAITLSLFVERYREHQQEEKLEHAFLSNLANDLKGDMKQLGEDSASYSVMKKSFEYLKQAYFGKKLNTDSAAFAVQNLYNTVEFVPASSRYDALKASGKLDVIENKKLQIDIVNLYQQTIAQLVIATHSFSNFKDKLGDYTDQNLIITKTGSNVQKFMESPVIFNMLGRDAYIDFIVSRYHATSTQARNIIKEVEEEEKDW